MARWHAWVGSWAGIGLTLIGAAAVVASPPAIEQTADAKLFDDQFRPQLVRYCITCHSGDKPKGKFRLDRLTTDFADAGTRCALDRGDRANRGGRNASQGKAESAGARS